MKIPKARKRGESYCIELMFNGKRVSATRDTEKECEQWAALKQQGCTQWWMDDLDDMRMSDFGEMIVNWSFLNIPNRM